MNTPLKLAGFGLGLAAAFGAALGVGSVVGPVGSVAEADEHAMGGEPAAGHDDGGHEATAADLPAGLTVSDSGYTLDLAERTLPAGPATPVEFRVVDADGQAV